MTPSHQRSVLLVWLGLGLGAEARAADPITVQPVEEAPAPVAEAAKPAASTSQLEQHRVPMNVLIERTVGATTKPVRFDWRKSPVGVGVVGSQLSELNNFRSARYGLFARTFLGVLMGELAVTRVETWNTPASRQLALTPYRQWGRPSRFELDVNLSFPLAEGVVTAWPSFFPATQLVLSGTAGVRYLVYPAVFRDASVREVAGAIFSPRLSEREHDNLDGARLAAMRVDNARLGFMLGLSIDLYFRNGFFVAPRALVAAPLFSLATDSKLGFWCELSLALGWAF